MTRLTPEREKAWREMLATGMKSLDLGDQIALFAELDALLERLRGGK